MKVLLLMGAKRTRSRVSSRDVLPVYLSSDPYHRSFEERLDIRRYHAYGKRAGGMVFVKAGDRLMLNTIVESTRIRGVWLRKVGGRQSP